MRTKIIAGNWKMNKTVPEALDLVNNLTPRVAGKSHIDVVICPPYTALYPVREALRGTSLKIGAQDVFWKGSGAYTGQISVPMLVDAGAQYVLLGHSETRGRFGVPEAEMTPELMRTFGETDAGVNIKALASLAGGLQPIICVGETLLERQDGQTDAVVQGQVTRAVQSISADQVTSQVIFAYEPVWAIGTGEVCAAEEANRVCGVIRQTVEDLYDTRVAEGVRIQYGGSMKPDNARELLAQPHIDGGLIGGASLKAADFAAIVAAAE